VRSRLPTIWDSVDGALVLAVIPPNTATGLRGGAAWFFWAGAYELLAAASASVASVIVLILVMREWRAAVPAAPDESRAR
jgi:hypothetical protein